jgi:hypothetical protein
VELARLWPRAGRRRRARSPSGPLHVCAGCGEAFVYPVSWSEVGPSGWWLLLRCGSCGAWHERFAPNHAVEAFDRFLDRGIESIALALERLDRERLAAQADTFAAALRMDLIGAEDFR